MYVYWPFSRRLGGVNPRRELMPAGKGWPGMRDPGYIRWDRQLAESHAHSRKAEVSVSLTDFLNLQLQLAGFLPPTPKWARYLV